MLSKCNIISNNVILYCYYFLVRHVHYGVVNECSSARTVEILLDFCNSLISHPKNKALVLASTVPK